jgi:hypothetical protein
LFFAFLLVRLVLQPRPWGGWRDPTAFAMAVGLSASLVSQVLFLASDNFYADIRLFMIWLTAGTLQALCLQQRAQAARAAPAPAADASTTTTTTTPEPWRDAA